MIHVKCKTDLPEAWNLREILWRVQMFLFYNENLKIKKIFFKKKYRNVYYKEMFDFILRCIN